MSRARIVILLLCCIPLFGASAETQVCLKKVFDSYCLGGSMQQLLDQNPVNTQPRTKGERTGVVYQKDNEKIYVMAYKGIIYKIVHTYEPETLVTMRQLQRRLQREYGDYQDRSEYPDKTKNQSRQLGYIRRGEGVMRYVWQPPGQTWRVELGWARKLGINVAYFVNELDQMQEEAALKGL